MTAGPDAADAFAPLEVLLDEVRAGRLIVLTADREAQSEGVLVVAAQFTTPEVVRFMAVEGCGIIYLALTPERVAELGLAPMTPRAEWTWERPVTASIEAREGVTTGISAADRSHTILTAVDPARGGESIVSPGHVFPVAVSPDGVLGLGGYAEAIVDMARMTGLNPSGAACKILSPDGSTARRRELIDFARRHGLKIGAVSDLIAHRRRTELLTERVSSAPFAGRLSGAWERHVYRNRITGEGTVVLVKRAPGVSGDRAMLTRLHRLSLNDDVLSGENRVFQAMQGVAAEGCGVLILHGVEPGLTQADAAGDPETAARILRDLDIRHVELLGGDAATAKQIGAAGVVVTGVRPFGA